MDLVLILPCQPVVESVVVGTDVRSIDSEAILRFEPLEQQQERPHVSV